MREKENEGGVCWGLLGGMVGGTGGRVSLHSCSDLCSHHVRSDWESRLYDGENGKKGASINSPMKLISANLNKFHVS